MCTTCTSGRSAPICTRCRATSPSPTSRLRPATSSSTTCRRRCAASSHMSKRNLAVLLLLLTAIAAVAQTPARHPLKLDDLQRFRDVRDPQLSPDGEWIAYVVSTVDVKGDKSSAHVWLVGYDGKGD